MIRLERGARLVLASHNPGKLAEITALLTPFGIDVVAAAALGLGEPEETGADFVANARIKATAAARGAGLPALADDSGFSVAALDGAPGVVSARWAGPGEDFGAAMARVAQAVGDHPDRRGWFTAALCLAAPDGRTATFQGRVDGTLALPPRGSRGFGYDPMFVPEGYAETFGEMDPATKESISHRARAFAALRVACLPG
ncbi:MAG: RdgB/HAM1 family non-canonical purine NTP pyrophosphatase [Acetobacteraceae bacterium]